MPTVKDRCPA